MLREQLQSLLSQEWRPAFQQERTFQRAAEHVIAVSCVLGRRTISRTICALGRMGRDWSADYKMFSRSEWESNRLFQPAIDEYVDRYPTGPVVAAIDDTKLKKIGKKILSAFWQRDPLSPKFHVNLMWGLRFLQVSLLFGHHREGDYPARGIPVRFQEAPAIKKPGKRATDEQKEEYRQLKKEANLSTQAVAVLKSLRADLDERGGAGRPLLIAADGSFCNRTIFGAVLDRILVIARCRKDARLCFPAAPGQRRKYEDKVFTPDEVRQQKKRPWKQTKAYLGGKTRKVKYKEVKNVLWRRGSATRKLRLIVIAPVPYKLSPNSRVNYRDPAFYLTTDLKTSVKFLVQACFDRWQIEVNHRDEKDILGVGQAQVRSPKSVARHPAMMVAAYSMLLLAALREFGPGRTDHYLLHPKWRKSSKRPSLLDIVTRLRMDYNEAPVSALPHPNFNQNRLLYADT